MAGSLHRCHYSYNNIYYASNDIREIRHELEDWKELVLPLANLLKWDQPFYPVITVGATAICFTILQYSEMSTVTALSLACMLLALFDYVFLWLRPVICRYWMWTHQDEREFLEVCVTIERFRQDIVESWHGLQALRRENAPFFLFIMMVVLATTAWLGSTVDNFLLTYIIVNGLLLIPGMYHHRVGKKYTDLLATFFNTLSQIQMKWSSRRVRYARS